jgi:hypothetical protein
VRNFEVIENTSSGGQGQAPHLPSIIIFTSLGLSAFSLSPSILAFFLTFFFLSAFFLTFFCLPAFPVFFLPHGSVAGVRERLLSESEAGIASHLRKKGCA